MINIDCVLIKELLDYNPETGIFVWKKSPSNRVKVGDIAGNLSSTTGYITIGINGKRIAAHRLAWAYIHGVNPSDMIDHKNQIRSDNRIDNLREATFCQNKQNSKAHKDSKSKYCGVFFERALGKWRAQICANGKRKHIGVFKTEIKAAKAYDKAAREIHGEFAKTNFNGEENR